MPLLPSDSRSTLPRFSSGEGEHTVLGEKHFAKLRTRINFQWNGPRLLERTEMIRRAVHKAVRELVFPGAPFSYQCGRHCYRGLALPVDISAAFLVASKPACSLSISARAVGSNDQSIWQPRSEVVKALRQVGFVSEEKGPNIFFERGRINNDNVVQLRATVLENDGLLYPEFLKFADRVDSAQRQRALRYAAQAHLLGATSSFPTRWPGYEPVWAPWDWQTLCDWQKAGVLPVLCKNSDEASDLALEHWYKTQVFCGSDELDRAEDSALVCLGWWKRDGQHALGEAKELFGSQFLPKPLNWETGENSDNFGIAAHVVAEFQQALRVARARYGV